MRKFYKVRDRGKYSRNRYIFEIYHEYPEAGPIGSSGRGPYCINWLYVPSKELGFYRSELAARNFTEEQA